MCDSCYTGLDCDSECANHGNCSSETCTCESGWWGKIFFPCMHSREANTYTTRPGLFSTFYIICCFYQTMIQYVYIYFVCLGPTCGYQGCPGISSNCTDHGRCSAQIQTCFCYQGWRGDGCHVPDCPGVPDCNARGM